jgi:hypothetical protein
MNAISAENIDIAGAPVNIFMLLGLQQRGQLIDLIGNGNPISSGDMPGYEAANAFNKYATYWRSLQRSNDVIASSFIGYDFGMLKLDTGRQKYSNGAPVLVNISNITIKQGNKSNHRATQARIERSMDGSKWYGVDIINLPDDSSLHTISFKSSVPSRFWRLRPLVFNGGTTDFWEIGAIQMTEYHGITDVTDIQDKIFLENRERDYSTVPVTLSGYFSLVQDAIDLTKFGMAMTSQTYSIKFNFSSVVNALHRPVVIGDIIQLPSETQFDTSLNPVSKYLQVVDTMWSNEGYTPGWTPIIIEIRAEPVLTSQENRQIFDAFNDDVVDSSNVFTNSLVSHSYQDPTDINNNLRAESLLLCPERGADAEQQQEYFTTTDTAAFAVSGISLDQLNYNPLAHYIEDAMPPNGLPYTEGDTFPTSPVDKAYHRLTYSTIDQFIPTVLYRYSLKKRKWIYMSTDQRAEFNKDKPLLQEFLTSHNSKTPQQLNQYPKK